MTENEVLAWIRLQRVQGIGPVLGRKLAAHFGDVQKIFSQSQKQLVHIHGVGPKMAGNLLNSKYREEAEQEYLKAESRGIQCLPLSGRAYPTLLKECADAPLVLFQKGPLEFSGNIALSVVGTRNMTSYGRRFCEHLLEEIKPFNPLIISGLAYGVDICIQRMAIKMGFRTVSCMGHGLDMVYPGAHVKYISEILKEGALLSEFWLGTTPQPMNFVRRNRIIAGLSPATVVVESGLKGGSLITADLAFDYNREVFAVPGRISDAYSAGCNLLIDQQKAHLLQSVQQLAGTLNWVSSGHTPGQKTQKKIEASAPELNPEEARIWKFLSENGVQILDDIAISCELTVREAVVVLLGMEMKDIIRPLPGKKFELTPKFTN